MTKNRRHGLQRDEYPSRLLLLKQALSAAEDLHNDLSGRYHVGTCMPKEPGPAERLTFFAAELEEIGVSGDIVERLRLTARAYDLTAEVAEGARDELAEEAQASLRLWHALTPPDR